MPVVTSIRRGKAGALNIGLIPAGHCARIHIVMLPLVIFLSPWDGKDPGDN